MADEGFKRKLAAILSADVEGYSRLMDDDEEATVRTITSYRNVITDLTQQFRGRVVDSPGDNILADFTSVVDAVNCAVEIQRDLAERNAKLPDNRKMQFRIGVNLGDVIDEDGRIYGDGVNIAARVESLADAGGICISGRAHDQVENKLGLEYEDLGKHEVKNISRPIQVYRVLSYPGAAAHRVVKAKVTLGRKWRKIGISVAAIVIVAVAIGIWQFYMHRPDVEPASVEKMAFPLPEKPSIAVLPFVNMSDDPRKAFLSDAFTEQIITSLSKVPRIFVISRTSTFSYKDKSVKVQQVAEELGVRYVLEGSIQHSGDKIRITAQLIDALTGRHLWAQRYERNYEDIFSLQDEITLKILNEIGVKLTEGESIHSLTKTITNLDAFEKWMEGLTYLRAFNIESNETARRLAEEAIALDPAFSKSYNLLAAVNIMDVWLGSSKSPPKSLAQATELLKKAIELNENDDGSYSLLCHVYAMYRQFDKAVEMGQKAIEINPNSADALVWLAMPLRWMGKTDEAIELNKKAIRLSPFPPSFFYLNLGQAYRAAGRCEEAIPEYKKALHLTPQNAPVFEGLTICYGLLGRWEESRAAATELIKLNPNFTIKLSMKKSLHTNRELVESWNDIMRKAGLPEQPPLPLPDKPSIAVLAFDNLSGDPEQEYFSDGIAENIITALSKVGELFVIARNSSFTYKGKPVKVQQISRELGVRYVLEGSVQRSGDRVRITAQLIDAKSGKHVWAENYDRDFKEIFEIQDEITSQIVAALRIKLTEGEQARILAEKIKNLDVYLKIAQAQSLWRDGTNESLIRWGQLSQEIIDMEPESAIGYRLLGWYHYGLASRYRSPQENIEKSIKLAQKALSLDVYDAFSHLLLSSTYSFLGKHEKAIELGKRSVELAPNGAMVYGHYGGILSYSCRFDEAISQVKQGIRLNPYPAYWYYTHLGRCYMMKNQYEGALVEFKKALQLAPDSEYIHLHLAMIYSLLDREEEARASAKKTLEINPIISVTVVSLTWRYKCRDNFEIALDAMRKAGFPE